MKKNIIYKGLFYSFLLVLFQSLKYNLIKNLNLKTTIIGHQIDESIPFIPEFVYFYYIWYLLVFFVPFVIYLYSKKHFIRYALAAVIGNIIVAACYIIYPAAIIRASFEVNNLSTYIVDLTYRFDYPVTNCFPSSHCFFAFLFIFATYGLKEIKLCYRIGLWLTSIMIVLSTLFIKQHVLIDVIGALILLLIIVPIIMIIEKEPKLK